MDDLQLDYREYLESIEWPLDASVGDWRRYISDEVRVVWQTLTYEQRLAIAQNANVIAWEAYRPTLISPTQH